MADHGLIKQSSAAPIRKVRLGGLATLAPVVLVAAGTAVTPELLDFAGRWSVVIFAGLVGGLGWLTSYLARASTSDE